MRSIKIILNNCCRARAMPDTTPQCWASNAPTASRCGTFFNRSSRRKRQDKQKGSDPGKGTSFFCMQKSNILYPATMGPRLLHEVVPARRAFAGIHQPFFMQVSQHLLATGPAHLKRKPRVQGEPMLRYLHGRTLTQVGKGKYHLIFDTALRLIPRRHLQRLRK